MRAEESLATLPITQLKGVGAKVAEKLAKIGLNTVQDVLFHLPSRYEDRTRIYTIGDCRPFTHVSILGEVMSADIQYGKKRMLVVKLSDGTGTITLRFFHFGTLQRNMMTPGNELRCFGEIRTGKWGLEMMHPEFKLIEADTEELEETLTPVYPTTEGVKQLTLRNLTEQALAMLDKGALNDLLPDGMYSQQVSLADALKLVHRPPPSVAVEQLEDGKHPAQMRLILEELLAQHLSVLKIRQQSDAQPGIAIDVDNGLIDKLLGNLPFSPTGAQQRVVADIQQDMRQPRPMMRLVQGDVGSGKTLVAALAALSAIGAGYQVALMAPTELLAEQHANNFSQWLEPLGIQVGWLAGKLKGKAREQVLENLANGTIQMLVGTHAIFQEQVTYSQLALVIVDEQHRFGVHQRLALREKGEAQGRFPHQLIMTATPIPRTLAMTAYADLDTSVIDELPPGRTPVKTVALPDTRRGDVIERVREACGEQGRQAYWVCTLIDESEVLQCQAAEDTAVILKTALPDLNVGLVHGRLKAAEKLAVMDAFKAGELDLLVATTVIEVGVDVPNASLMIIENPERLGLAQLHQLRGRVGRGAVESHCVLMYQSPLSKTATKRLAVLRESNDGFYIAQRDLEIRGPGELMGTRQTGMAELKIADLVRDAQLIPQVQHIAVKLWQEYPSHAQAIINRWIGHKEQYGHA
ncbi:MAG: ATP-dependent DNA helicase RecG [Pseudomonadota bacterium]|jgi:ATP-dependent DNA helicase RecG|uniref:ATP-dependent DNA helicase RecG n=2 Tax=Marisediminitalea TaxID=2662254 RepID=UPI000C469562|nr:ATP-dependent DNA helicase RecG [Marisediminitalea aggregata]MAP22561.1 ATP-dependent DNA helicase RecG [Alteromonadaceae bacterium]MCP3866304.1 ATP-dependent DNA helicase RecG [Aestuariibacter sp.]MEC7826568.1 ATP-dependent DNA helicase RecG [Pseudomonadota bacterium]MAX41219.1 ATP-dependent DNA helicase RecG [Alteromonadaceae bacterium]MBL53915.1 ATP-dependent DNA helicase RecG [Alteromonadaceae bacterium]|tara:strand:+ start:49644 stop:51725 length:2082 start_codon:yes stop_codon:yes gene_type:complete